MAEYKYDAWGNHRVYTGTGIDITDNSSYNNSVAKLNPFRYRGYYYDTETGLYYLNSRYYDPSIGRFINADDISYIQPTDINGLNLFAYGYNNPVMYTDPEGNMPNWLKWIIGGIAFVGATVITALTAGAITPLIIGMGISIISGGLIQGVISKNSGGNFWDGFWDGAADGAMWGGIFALAGSVFRIVKIAKKGLTIGKTGTFEEIAKLSKTYHYKGLKSHAFLTKVFGRSFADKVGWTQNKFLVNTVKFFKGAIYDTGGQLTGAYAKEVLLTKGYKYLFNVWVF